MSRSASYTPRFLALPRFRARRGLTGADWARISAMVRSSGSGLGDAWSLIAAKSPFITTRLPSAGHGPSLTLGQPQTTFPSLPRCRSRAGQYSGGVAQLGERVNGIHEVRGSIPLASMAPFGRATTPLVGSLRRG